MSEQEDDENILGEDGATASDDVHMHVAADSQRMDTGGTCSVSTPFRLNALGQPIGLAVEEWSPRPRPPRTMLEVRPTNA